MNSDLKIGLVVSGSVIICLFFVAFTTPTFGNKIDKNPIVEPTKGNIALNLKTGENQENDPDVEDDFSLEYVTLGEEDEKNKVESYESKKADNVKEEINQIDIKDENAQNDLKNVSGLVKKSNDEERNEQKVTEIEEEKAEITKIVAVKTDSDMNQQNKVIEPKDEVKESLKEVLQEDIIYTVKQGDNLSKIAKFYYLDALKHVEISKANNGLKSNNLKIGQKIKLPGIKNIDRVKIKPKKLLKSNLVTSDQDIIYQVKKGDIASIIIQKYYGSFKYLKDVKKANPKVNLDRLKIGQKLTLPGLGKK